jgi:hypothetical protein
MRSKVIKVLQPFLTFTFSFQPHSAHNMLVLMQDLHFKNLQIIPNFVGLESIVEIIVEYDHEILLLVLLIVYNRLTQPSLELKVTFCRFWVVLDP